jgi:hypothetical protein
MRRSGRRSVARASFHVREPASLPARSPVGDVPSASRPPACGHGVPVIAIPGIGPAGAAVRPRAGGGLLGAWIFAGLLLASPVVAAACAQDASSLASTVRYWAERLGATDPDARAEAAVALGETRSEAALPPLLVRLGDPDERVRLAVVRALARLGPAAASSTPALRALLADPSPAVRGAAGAALDALGQPR